MSDDKKKSLENDEILTERKLGRRSTLGVIGAGVLGAAALTTLGAANAPSRAKAQTDSDSGPNADAAGRGSTGHTDSDSGPNADRGGHGHRQCSDSDAGPNSDPAGRGRSC